jgi:hypothetical protein
MTKEIVIDYDPFYEIDNEKHDALEKIVDKYDILTTGRKNWVGELLLLFPAGIDLTKLTEELKPIKILNSA